jgi:hypothetical protein
MYVARAGPDGPLRLRNGGGAGVREGAGPDLAPGARMRPPSRAGEDAYFTIASGNHGSRLVPGP